MEVQQVIVAAGYEFWNWTAGLSKSHLIAMAACYGFGYWLRGHRHES